MHQAQRSYNIRSLAAVGGAMLASFAGSAVSYAGTIRHDRPDTSYRSLASQSQFAGVGHYSAGTVYGSFTLIAPNWGLTAAHVVDVNGNGQLDDTFTNDVLTIGGQQRTVTQAIVPVGINGNRGWNGNINAGFDIALVRFDTPFDDDIKPASIYTGFQELGKTITQVGYGSTGNGQTGSYLSGGRSSKRAGNNMVDRYVNFSNGATALRWDFDEAGGPSPNQSGSTNPLDLEYLIAGGDSGGGSFIFENNAWYLAGVHSGTYNAYLYPDSPTAPDDAEDGSTYGDESLVTRVAAYQDFIFNSIPELAVAVPEPSSLALLGLAGLLVTRRRR